MAVSATAPAGGQTGIGQAAHGARAKYHAPLQRATQGGEKGAGALCARLARQSVGADENGHDGDGTPPVRGEHKHAPRPNRCHEVHGPHAHTRVRTPRDMSSATTCTEIIRTKRSGETCSSSALILHEALADCQGVFATEEPPSCGEESPTPTHGQKNTRLVAKPAGQNIA